MKVINIDKGILPFKTSSACVNLVITSQLSGRRSGNHETKTTSTVHGTNRKPYRQKGLGVARQGSRKEPHMIHGGVSHGPHNDKIYELKVNKKLMLKVIRSVVADKIDHDSAILIDRYTESMKTKDVISELQNIGITSDTKTLFIVKDKSVSFINGIRNIKNMNILPVDGLNAYDIMKYQRLVMDSDSFIGVMKKLKVEDIAQDMISRLVV